MQINKAFSNKGTLDGKTKATDYTGRTIAGYRILYPLKKRAKNRSVLWRVQCISCLHEKTFRSDQLASQHMPVCPCERLRQKENAKRDFNNLIKEG